MAQIYGELIRAQLQVSSSALSPTATGLVYFNSSTGTDAGLNWYAGSAWKTAVDLNSLQTLSAKTLDATCVISSAASLPLVTLAKGGLGADASAWSGVLKASGGTISAATIVNADISATAAIDATKIASGAVSNFKFDKLNTAGSNGPDLLVNTDGTQNLTNKRLIGCRVDDWSDFTEETTSQASPSGGLLRIYAKNDHKLYKIWDGGTETEIGSGGAGGTVFTITAANTFAIGDAIYFNGTAYAKAKADAAATSEVLGVVSRATASDFDLTLTGEVEKPLWGLTPGEVYFLSPTTAGLLVTTEPTTIGQISLPVGVASSATKMYVAPKRGAVVGGTNARASVSLTSGATTNVQNLAGYDAGELTGWVFISSAAPVRFYVSAKFAKSGAGGDYNLSYQTTGDVPPVGFSLQISTSGLLSCTLPASSGSTSVINYALNAPAIGASFPLTVDAGTILSGTVDSARLPVLVKTQLKTLPSTIAGSANPTSANSNLSFNNLVSGKIYRVDAQFETDTGPGQIWFLWGSSSNNSEYRYAGTPTGVASSVSFVFTAVNTTLLVYLGNSSANYRATDGNSTPTNISGGFPKVTWVQLTEMSNAAVTTSFT